MKTTINYNGIIITLESEYVGTATPWGGEYVRDQHNIKVTIDDKDISFNYFCNNDLGEDDLIFAFYCFLSDGITYLDYQNMDDFQDAFGYSKVSECLKVYNGCKEAYYKWSEFTDIDIFEINNWLQDNYNL